MILNKRLVVVMPAYNAAQTIERVYGELPEGMVDHVILVDDASADETVKIARRLGLDVHVHGENLGYGANQKTCYKAALDAGADIVVMLHPDYQYPPKLVAPMGMMIATEEFDLVLGSRILCRNAERGGMPRYKYWSNRFLTAVENLLLGSKLSEFHTGFRAYSADALRRIPFEQNSDDFVFDNQILAQAILGGLRIGELSSPCAYRPDSSSIGFGRSVMYGFGVLGVSMAGFFHRCGLRRRDAFRLAPEPTRSKQVAPPR